MTTKTEATQPSGLREALEKLHFLTDAPSDGDRYSFCNADGYASDDLDENPCPTLAALAQHSTELVAAALNHADVMAALEQVYRDGATGGEWPTLGADAVMDLLQRSEPAVVTSPLDAGLRTALGHMVTRADERAAERQAQGRAAIVAKVDIEAIRGLLADHHPAEVTGATSDDPAGRLSAAADLLDQRVAVATGGPWVVFRDSAGFATRINGGPETRDVVVSAGVLMGVDADYIAAVHPEVGRRLSNRLRREAAVRRPDEDLLAIADLVLAGVPA